MIYSALIGDLSTEGLPGVFVEQGNMIIYLEGTMHIFQFNLWERETSFLFKGTLSKHFRKQRTLLMGNKGVKGIK